MCVAVCRVLRAHARGGASGGGGGAQEVQDTQLICTLSLVSGARRRHEVSEQIVAASLFLARTSDAPTATRQLRKRIPACFLFVHPACCACKREWVRRRRES
ncbi:hypothetical protein EON62_01085 [archaeon]|nr:MAG: hypothetical protein EON62_01085 [archaeon]